ncbi:MAG TPA: YcxB family protein [Pirellulaceae bacterium]|nr:YcxB family protein [Pirellulaceae bacterium]
MRRHYRTRLQPLRDGIASIVAICGGLYLYLFTTSRVLPWFLIIPGVILGLLVAYAFILLPSQIFQSQPKLKSEYHLQFGDDAIRFKTDEIDSTLQWSTYHSWLRDNEFYILYHGIRDFTVVPLRALERDANEQLAELLDRKIGAPKIC